MYWQEQLLTSANENRSEAVNFSAGGYNHREIDAVVAKARLAQQRKVHEAFTILFASVSWLVRELRDRTSRRKAYSDLVHSDARLLADIGLDRHQLRNAVFGAKKDSIFVAIFKALNGADKRIEDKNVELSVVETATGVVVNDDHRQAA